MWVVWAVWVVWVDLLPHKHLTHGTPHWVHMPEAILHMHLPHRATHYVTVSPKSLDLCNLVPMLGVVMLGHCMVRHSKLWA